MYFQKNRFDMTVYQLLVSTNLHDTSLRSRAFLATPGGLITGFSIHLNLLKSGGR